MSRLKNISRFLLGALAVAAAASTIGLAPAASAKAIMLPMESCTGPDISANACEKPPQPVPPHILGPHGLKYRKIAIAAERGQTNSASDCSTPSRQDGR